MKIAIVHDSFVEFGGAERVIQSLLDVYPYADIYTAYANGEIVKKFFPNLSTRQFHTSWVQDSLIATHGSLFQLVSPLVWKSFHLEHYDVVLSATSYLGSNMVSVIHPIHIQYIQSLPKNLYGLDPVYRLQRVFPYSAILRRLVQKSLQSSPYIFSNSKHIQTMIYEKTGVHSNVIYPPVKIPATPPRKKRPLYYLCVSRIDRSKSLEVAIQACNALHAPLKIVGQTNEPHYESYLRTLAGPTVEFLGFVPDRDMMSLYAHANAFIFTARNEDFGIAPVEAMAHGVPVLAYDAAGVRETVIHTVTGMLFKDHTSQSLQQTMKRFKPQSFSPYELYTHAKRFSDTTFKKHIENVIQRALQKQHAH